MKKKKLYFKIGNILPEFYVKLITEIFNYSGKRNIDAKEYLGGITIFSVLCALCVPLVPFALGKPFGIFYAIGSIGIFVLIHYLSYLLLYIGLEDYTKRIESVLPDFLRLVSANVRSGMTPFSALKLSALPEFGPLKEEVEYVTIRGLGTEDFSDLIVNINKHIKSESMDRVLRLFSSTVKSGGHLAQILENSATDIEEKRRLKKELSTITKSYSIFIMFAVIVIAPFLLSISIQFLTMIIKIQEQTMSTESFGSFGGAIQISPSFLSAAAIGFLFTTGMLSSMLTAVISQEKMQYGLKYALIIITLSLISFYGANRVISGMFGN